MPTPSNARGTYNPVLSQVAIAYEQSLSDYIAPGVFPIVPSAEGLDTGIYFKFGKEAYQRQTTLIADGAAAPLVDYKATEGTYKCLEYGSAARVTKGERRNNKLPGPIEARKTKQTVRAIELDWEFRVSTLLTDTGTFAHDTPSTKFDNDGDFVGMILDKKELVRKALGGQEPNCLIFSPAVFRALQSNQSILDLMIYSERGKVTLDIIKAFVDIPNIRLAKAVYNSAAEGQTAVMVDVWGDSMFLGWVSGEPAIDQPTLGLTIRSQEPRTTMWYDDETQSDYIRTDVVQTEQVTCADAGYVITDCLT